MGSPGWRSDRKKRRKEMEKIAEKAPRLGGTVETCHTCEHCEGEYCTLLYHGFEMDCCEIVAAEEGK
jgi:hypothetical protein